MRYLISLLFFSLFVNANLKLIAQEQEQLNLPGDNLNLYAVLKLFQESKTLESFEKSLNEENNKINNLDLNGDGKTDYIFIDDSLVNNVHNILLRIAVNATETQSVAVIAVEKDNSGQVNMQLIGDEDLYGKDYIVEPDSEGLAQTQNPGYSGNASQAPLPQDNVQVDASAAYYPVNFWPVIQYIYVPTYSAWRSPWFWNYYPSYWTPWRPFYWHTYYAYQYHWNYYYSAHYRQVNVYRIPGWRQKYYNTPGFRSRSVVVKTRYQQGNYRQTYSRPHFANRGTELFRRDHPNAPSVNTKPPLFDKNGRPVVINSGRPVTNAGTRPIARPIVTNPRTRPVKNPGTRPANPLTRPVVNPGTRPSNRPIAHPVTRPVSPSVNRPAQRPSVSQPSKRPINSPGARPAISRHQTERPTPQTQASAVRERDDH
ncbi:MAG: hypothetical protein ABI415_00080 [Flavitalea sp.]